MSNIDLKETVELLRDCENNFYNFTTKIFAKSFTNFIGGDYVKNSCDYLQKYDRTMRIAFRSGFKSTSYYAYTMLNIMYRGINEDLDIRYFSYSYDLAGWHIQQIKSLIAKNPYFSELKNLKAMAENVASYTWDGRHIIRIRPMGIVSFSRGLKSDIILCVGPNTQILSSHGSVPIKTLKVGQEVFTHTGELEKIKKVYKRKIDEDVIRLTIQDSDELLLTKNHRVLVYEIQKHKKCQVCTPECSFHGEKLKRKATLHTGKTFPGPKARYAIKMNPTLYLSYKLKWKMAGELTYNDYILFPDDLKELKDNFYLFNSNTKKKNSRSQRIRKDYLNTYEFWKFLGYFLADGSTSKGNITISFNKSEKKFIVDCFTIIQNLGFIPHLYSVNGKNITNLVICNAPFSRFLKDNFYNGKFKILPSENIPKKFISVLLQGFITGDGYISKYGIRITSIGLDLLKQLQRLMLRIHVRSNIYEMKASKPNMIMGRKLLHIEPKFELRIPTSDYEKLGYLNNQKTQKPKTFFWNSFSARHIKKIEKVHYKGDVYNLEVDKNHSYLSHLITLKNCDDILSDAANPIHPTVILKIGDIFKSVILESIKPGGEIHVAGSPLTRADLYFDPGLQKEFHTRFYPAITKDDNGSEVSTWPEFYTLEQIKAKIPIMGERAFQAEMMMEPYYSTDAFFKKENLRKDVVNPSLKNIPLAQGLNTPNLVIAGLDIGKKKHKSAFHIYEIRDGKAIQVHRKSMTHWPYYSGKPWNPLRPTQVEYCKEAIKNFGITCLYYDNTRGEFEGANDSGLLSTRFIPIVFTSKMKVQMATDVEKIVGNKQVELIDDEEMLTSICSVTNDLQKLDIRGDHCYDDKTEILTKKGWKLFKDLMADDVVGTLKDGKYLEYQKPIKIITENYSGKMYKIKGQQIDLVVSPNHRLYVGSSHPYMAKIESNNKKIKNKWLTNYRWKLKTPKDIFHKFAFFKKDFEWAGKKEKYFILPERKINNGKYFPSLKIKMNDWLSFLGIYLSEGNTPHRANQPCNTVNIWQNRGGGYDKIRKILKKLPFKFVENERSFAIYNAQLANYTKNIGRYSYSKYIPTEFKLLNKKQLKFLFDSLILGDGTRKTYSYAKTLCFYSSSKKLIDDMQEIGLKMGFISNILIRDMIGRKAPHGITRKLNYRLNFFKSSSPTIINKDKTKGKFIDSWINYNGKIYCVTVPNHIVYVRRNGRSCWSGNSDDWDAFNLAMIGFNKYGATGIDNKVRVGSKSIFDQKCAPKGF